jgi:tetratricopeptide (TPR) repeat protein
LALRLEIDFKQNRYRDITKTAGSLEESTLIIPETGRPHYIRILQLIGDSFLKLDYIYDAEKYYAKALDMNPGNLETLLRILRCYERLNDDQKAARVRETLSGILTAPEIDLGNRRLEKGEACPIALVSEGRPLSIRVEFTAVQPSSHPLVTALLNDRVLWEGYVEAGTISFSAVPRSGVNSLVLRAVSQPVLVRRVKLAPPPAR